MSVELTAGAIEALYNDLGVKNPVLQLLNICPVDTKAGLPRFRLMMSDGRHSLSTFLLSTQLNTLVEENRLVPFCVCKLKKTIMNELADGRHVVIVIDMEIVTSAEDAGEKIGAPRPLKPGAKTQLESPQRPSPSSPALSSSPLDAQPGPSRVQSSRHGTGGAFVKKNPSNSPAKAPTHSPAKTPQASPVKVVPIASLNPYQNKWTIRARVTNKTQIRTWSNSRGDGKLFSLDVVDESGEIKITAFNNEAERFFPLVEKDKVYCISKATIKMANKKFSTLNNDYEMSLHAHTTIVPCEDGEGVPTLRCDFVPIAELENREKDDVIDVIGVCKSASEVSCVTTRMGKEVSKRALDLMDTSGKVVTVTLWGEEAERFDGSRQPVLAIRGARLSDFGGRSLSTVFSSTLLVNPDIPEAIRLRAWFDHEGYRLDSQSLTTAGGGATVSWRTLSDLKNGHIGQGEKAEYFSCVATVVYIRKENCLYQACPSADCFKKVTQQQNGLYRCDKCSRDFPDFKPRLLLSVNIADYGENHWVTCFQDTAEVLLGHSAQTLGQLRDTDENAFDEVFQRASFTTHIFRTRVKLETYNDESRVKATVVEIQPLGHRDYSRRLISNIRKMAA
ncbi:unnamed protein product [Lota lota]